MAHHRLLPSRRQRRSTRKYSKTAAARSKSGVSISTDTGARPRHRENQRKAIDAAGREFHKSFVGRYRSAAHKSKRKLAMLRSFPTLTRFPSKNEPMAIIQESKGLRNPLIAAKSSPLCRWRAIPM
jgi:hypothetical protein